MVCDNHVELYEVDDHEGSTYTWEVTGGVITEGQGTYMVTITWGDPGAGIISVEEETSSGCAGSSDDFEVFIDDCTGIDESVKEGELALYPNPASEVLNLKFVSAENNIIVSVCNQLGQKIISQQINTSNEVKTLQFNISELQTGLYFIKIENEHQLLTHKQFIKK
jgi:hypothetical protein